MKAFYDSQVKSFEMKNESFLIKEKTKINIANKILSLFRVQASNWIFPLFTRDRKICLYSDYSTSLARPLLGLLLNVH